MNFHVVNCFEVLGGGGGFLQAEVQVAPGEMLQVLIGGGGEASDGERGGAGGFNGGQSGIPCLHMGLLGLQLCCGIHTHHHFVSFTIKPNVSGRY